jgi:hypothetical protein
MTNSNPNTNTSTQNVIIEFSIIIDKDRTDLDQTVNRNLQINRDELDQILDHSINPLLRSESK